MRELETTLTDELLGPILERDPAGPRITHYDDSTGARIELSGSTLANWAAKTANMVRDEFGIQPGSRVAVLLPAHWQTAAVLLGVWWAGAEVALEPADDVDLALVTVDRLDEVASVDEVAVLSLDAFGNPVPDLPVGVTDYATSVRVHGDQFRSGGAGPALAGRSVREVINAARDSAAVQGFTDEDRVQSSTAWADTDGLVDGLLAVFAAGASLVQVTAPKPNRHRVTAEKITKQR